MIFHSYVSLPEGTHGYPGGELNYLNSRATGDAPRPGMSPLRRRSRSSEGYGPVLHWLKGASSLKNLTAPPYQYSSVFGCSLAAVIHESDVFSIKYAP